MAEDYSPSAPLSPRSLASSMHHHIAIIIIIVVAVVVVGIAVWDYRHTYQAMQTLPIDVVDGISVHFR